MAEPEAAEQPRTRKTRWWVVAMAVGGIAVISAAGWWFNQEPTKGFCTAQLSFTTIQGVNYRLQDQGSPGRDHCDRLMFDIKDPKRLASDPFFAEGYVGFDCKVHNADGSTTPTVTTPNLPDGLCGQWDGRR